MNRFASTRGLLAMALATVATATFAAPPPSRQLDEHVVNGPAPDISVLTHRCALPYEDRGTYQIPSGFGGAGTSAKAIPANKVLQVRSVTVTLDEADWRGADIGVWTARDFAWYPMRMHNGAAVFRVNQDGPLYADGGGQTFKFVSNRESGKGRAANGTYVIRGCLLDGIPKWVTIPDVRVPRYPKKRLTPLEPVELWDGVRGPMKQPER